MLLTTAACCAIWLASLSLYVHSTLAVPSQHCAPIVCPPPPPPLRTHPTPLHQRSQAPPVAAGRKAAAAGRTYGLTGSWQVVRTQNRTAPAGKGKKGCASVQLYSSFDEALTGNWRVVRTQERTGQKLAVRGILRFKRNTNTRQIQTQIQDRYKHIYKTNTGKWHVVRTQNKTKMISEGDIGIQEASAYGRTVWEYWLRRRTSKKEG